MALLQTPHYLKQPVAVAPLVTVRVVYGLLMLVSTLRFMYRGWVADHYLDPVFHFSYPGFEWVKALDPAGMYLVHGLMILAALGVTLGLWYRGSAALLWLLFTYTELIDLTYYLNHYYFVSLFGLLMVVVPAGRAGSLDVQLGRVKPLAEVPRWTIGILRFQLAMVYLYAGLFKIHSDWLLEALPLRIWLPAHSDLPLLGPWLAQPLTAYLFSWAGMLYDVTIVFWLLWDRSRPWAYLAVIAFHLMTGLLFQIGVFPLVMIGLTLVFFPAETHRRWHHRLGRWFPMSPVPPATPPGLPAWGTALLAVYVAFQLLFPWRFVLYGGQLFWDETGYRFGWRVMLVEKAGTATFFVQDPQSGREGVVDNREFLNAHQEKQMAFQPDMIRQFAHFLAEYYQEPGGPRPQVRAEVWVTWNGRPSRLLIDPAVDLAAQPDFWRKPAWVLPWPAE